MSTPTNQRILVAVDESEASRRAIDYVADMLGGRHGFHVGLLHLELPPRMLEWGGSEDSNVEDEISSERAEVYQKLEEKKIEDGQHMLEKLKGILTERGIDVTALLVRFEEPLDRKHIAHDVLNIAKERDYGTIVVGRHSFSGLKRLFQHHVGEELVRAGKRVTIWVVE
jgi:nucleotide-binding universal stress UspA family protein